jgi:DNA-binding winged helix-turn-helix (wHTH) protein
LREACFIREIGLIIPSDPPAVGLPETGVHFAFDEYALDVDRRELRRGSDLVALEPQVFDLLVYLVQNRDRVVSKDDLIATIWRGRVVSESTLTSRINAVRRAVGDSGERQTVIRTIARKGIRFVGTIRDGQKPDTVVAADMRPRCRTRQRAFRTSRRLQSFRLPISAAIPSSSISPMGLRRTSLRRCRGLVGSS